MEVRLLIQKERTLTVCKGMNEEQKCAHSTEEWNLPETETLCLITEPSQENKTTLQGKRKEENFQKEWDLPEKKKLP